MPTAAEIAKRAGAVKKVQERPAGEGVVTQKPSEPYPLQSTTQPYPLSK